MKNTVVEQFLLRPHSYEKNRGGAIFTPTPQLRDPTVAKDKKSAPF
jgi:hypothetical protein